MQHGIDEGMLICVKGHLFHPETLPDQCFTRSKVRGWCPIPACRMPLRKVVAVDRQGRALTEMLV